MHGFSPRGLDIDRNGVVWTVIASGHLASFDRRKCKGPLNGPTATGEHCPEGWTLYQLPGPQLKGVTDPGSAEASYYDWVDQFDTLGLGRNVPIATGNGNDALLALLPDTRKFVVLRVPYPMGFYAKGMDGRIDDPKGGQKGWTAGSMIRKAAGKERDCGPPTVPERLFTPKAAKERPARSCTSSFAPIRSHTKRNLFQRVTRQLPGKQTQEFAAGCTIFSWRQRPLRRLGRQETFGKPTVKKRRKVVVYIATSADGFIARPDGDVAWLDRPRPKGNYGMGEFSEPSTLSCGAARPTAGVSKRE